ncbi:MAG: hypothetical protein FWD05_10375 [Oscillospiraceae bacterium]|nr:hypothetical protein [Oscillospiraceae bacterium]
MSIAYSFPYDANARYLPMVYILPEEMIVKCPTLRKLPRCLGELAQSEELADLINSDQFLNEIMDAVSALAFPHFGFGGWKEHYTGYSPVWKLSYAIALWAKLLEEETGWGLQRLFQTPSTEIIPFFDPVHIREIMGRVVKRGIAEQNWQPILDVVKEMPCDEDFENWETNVRIDFIRKWYHTRSKRVQTISLEECLEDDDDHGVLYVEDKSANFENNFIEEDYVEQFKARLSEKDMMILELRVMGFTYKEVAEKLGYKNHSGVIKRIKAITKEFEKYEDARH